MNKVYSLIIALLAVQASIAQISLVDTDEPNVGDSVSYLLMDSLAPNLANITGANVTWDYSTILAYGQLARRKGFTKSASSSTYSNFFTSATHESYIEEHVHDFYSFNTSEKNSYGMQVTEQNNGDFLITHDPRKTRTYPWTYNSTLSGALSTGEVVVDPNGAGEAIFPANGTYDITCDGYGTLIVGDSTVPNVIRNHMYDSVRAKILFANATLIRHQYDYYIKDNPFPIFIHADIRVYGATLNVDYTLVLSQVPPNDYTGIDTKTAASFKLYPNPANTTLTIELEANEKKSEVRIYDLIGQLKMTQSLDLNTSIDISNLEVGNYIVKVVSEEDVVTQKLSIVR